MVHVRPPGAEVTVYEVIDPPGIGVMVTVASPSPATAVGAAGAWGEERIFWVKADQLFELVLPLFPDVRATPSPKLTACPWK